MSRQWKPGDVAMISFPSGDSRAMWIDEKWVVVGYASAAHYVDPRPLVVIDPEDREQVDLVISAYVARARELGRHVPEQHDGDRFDAMQTALRSLIANPKRDEPMGLGAVVVDQNDITYVMAGRLLPDGFPKDDKWRAIDGPIVGDWKRWDQIEVKQILSEGVTE